MLFSHSSKLFLASALVGTLLIATTSGVSEARHHRPIPQPTEQEVNMQRSIALNDSTGTASALPSVNPKTRSLEDRVATGSLSSRVHDILYPETEKDAANAGVKVPTTVSAYDDSILGTPLASQEQCVSYLLSVNPNPRISVTPQQLVSYYYEEGAREGIRPDVAFAQALKETGFFSYGGTVTPDQNNYSGLGTTSAYVKGAYFDSAQLGVRAQIQHLLAYSSTRQPSTPIVDPRYNLVRSAYGTSTLSRWSDLNGRWAVPGYSYGQSIMSIYRAILSR